jgi:hypothetical protein
MKTLPLCITTKNIQDDKVLEAMELKRKYVAVVIIGVNLKTNGANVLKIIQKHGSRICKIDIKHSKLLVNVESAECFIKLLNSLPILEKIGFDSVGRYFGDLKEAEIVKLIKNNPVQAKKLSKVVMSSTNFEILHFIQNSKIVSLKQDDMRYERVLLKNLPHLEEYALRKFVFSWMQIDFEKLSSPLKRLSLLRCKCDAQGSPMIFMKTISKTLEELEIGSKFQSDFYELVFKEFKKLQVLKIHVRKLPEFNKKLQPNESVKTLILYSKENFDEQIEPVIANLPNTETLVMKWQVEPEDEKRISNQQMKFIANHLQKLRVLQLRCVDKISFTNVKMPALRELHLTFHRYLMHDGWKAIAESCPNLEKIYITSVHSNHFCSPKAISVITQEFKKLKFLNIGNGFFAVKENFDDLMNNCKELELVRLTKNALRDNPSMADDFTKSGRRLILHNNDVFRKTDFGEIDFDLWSNEEEYWMTWEMKREMREEMGDEYLSTDTSGDETDESVETEASSEDESSSAEDSEESNYELD